MRHPVAAPPVLWDDGYEPAAPRARLVRRLALGAGVVIALAGAALSGLALVGRGAAPARELVPPPSAPPPSVVAAPAEPAPPRDTTPPPPLPAPPRPAVVVPAPAPAPAPGRLFVGATPWGELYIDDRPVGHTPMAALPIAAG